MIELRLPIPPSLNNMFPSKRGGKQTVALPANGMRLTASAYRGAVEAATTKGLGRVKSQEYKDWIRRADASFMAQRAGGKLLQESFQALSTTYQVEIRIPKIRGDIDNRIKAILDFLVRVGLTLDDKHARRVAIEEDLTLSGECVVTIAQRGLNVSNDVAIEF